ncbi:hypothetical protein FG386_001533 [Cryptosporidium ryanae]|uniref:uncharacterized protein n=1 Tax=Cryptosporidium ryanae TaxID=515981 RepID=UPI00351A6C0E|nr:hypothetical protein FG386_001533 [Cryptosporidium ryanae]
MHVVVLLFITIIVNVFGYNTKNHDLAKDHVHCCCSELDGKIMSYGDIKYYLTILFNEWKKIKKIINNKEGFSELNNDVKNLIFFKYLLEIEERVIFCKNEYIFCNYNLNWYNNYGLNNIDNVSRELFKIYSYNNTNCLTRNSKNIMNILYYRNANINLKNDNIINKLKLLILFYNQFEEDLAEYNYYINNFNLNEGETLNSNYSCSNKNIQVKNNIDHFNKKWNMNESEKKCYLKNIGIKNKGKNEFWTNYHEYYSFNKNIKILFNFLNKIMIKSNNIIENTKETMYKKVLYYYIWLIIMSKITLYILRKIALLYIFLDKFIIYIIDAIEDYLFMFISLQFTFELIKTVISEL